MKRVEASKLIKSFGNTSEEVAESLESLGVKGIGKVASKCPLAIALNKFSINNGRRVLVDGQCNIKYSDNLEGTGIIATQAAKDFVRDMDLGKYPNLDMIKENR